MFTFPYGEEGNLVDFCADNGKTCYLKSSLGWETPALLKVDLQTGKTLEEIFSSDQCNCGGVTLDKDTKEVRAVTFNYALVKRKFFDKELEEDSRVLESLDPDGTR